MFEEAQWDPQFVLELRDRKPDDPLLHWVVIWVAAKILLVDADEHPDHWKIKYYMFTEEEVCNIRNVAEKKVCSYWELRKTSPNFNKIQSIFAKYDRPEAIKKKKS